MLDSFACSLRAVVWVRVDVKLALDRENAG